MKAIIYDTEIQAKDADWQMNTLTGAVSRYRYARRLLTDTTVLTKDQYAGLLSIATELVDEEGVSTPNPAYIALESSYTLNKCALVVGDALDLVDEETGKRTAPSYVVDVSELLFTNTEE